VLLSARERRRHANDPVPLERRIAVLPFRNLSVLKEDEFLADGLHDAVITQLSRVAELQVTSRQSVRAFSNSEKSIQEIGKERTILLSTHNLSEVEQACARAIIVSKGRIVADGPLEEIRAKSGRVRYVVSIQESVGDKPYRGKGSPPRQAEVESALNALGGVHKVTELPTDERGYIQVMPGSTQTSVPGSLWVLTPPTCMRLYSRFVARWTVRCCMPPGRHCSAFAASSSSDHL